MVSTGSTDVLHELFISYSRIDKEWLDEELLPILNQMRIRYFIDDAESRKLQSGLNTDITAGLIPGDEIDPVLDSKISASRFVLFVLTPAYFLSDSCRKEANRCSQLSNSDSPPRWIPLILKRGEGERLDVFDWMRPTLYTDLTDVRKRCSQLMLAMTCLGTGRTEPARPCLGDYSRRQLMASQETQRRFDAFRSGFDEFCSEVAVLEAIKNVHDAIQEAQDALKQIGRDVRSGSDGHGMNTMDDLEDKLEKIMRHTDNDYFPKDQVTWIGRLTRLQTMFQNRRIPSAGSGSGNVSYLEAIDPQLAQEARNFLVHSSAASELSLMILNQCKSLRTEWARQMEEELGNLANLPWADGISTRLGELLAVVRDVKDAQTLMGSRVEAHDLLQRIETQFRGVLGDEATAIGLQGLREDLERSEMRLLRAITPPPLWLHRLERDFPAQNLDLENMRCFERTVATTFTMADVDILNSVKALIRKVGKTNQMLKTWVA